jgi:hypothetical protein
MKEGYLPLYSTLNSAEAHMIQFLFENNGISAIIENEGMVPLFGMIPERDAAARLWVPADKYREASVLLTKSSSLDLSGAAMVRCGSCGELVCEIFDFCWNCMANMKTGEPFRREVETTLDEVDTAIRFPVILYLVLAIVVLLVLGYLASRIIYS